MRVPVPGVVVIAAILVRTAARACIWDSDTLTQERAKNPKMADAVLGQPAKSDDPTRLHERITNLETNRRENDPSWWNDLAGAHLRLGAPRAVVELLEMVVNRFPDDYGIHANLGTAYHLLGRYK